MAKGEHGGKLRIGQRKIKRPLEEGKPTQVILESTSAKGRLSFTANRTAVDEIIEARAKKYSIDIESLEISAGQIRFVARFKKRLNFQNFLRTTPALVARKITGAVRGRPFNRRFWDHPARTYVVET